MLLTIAVLLDGLIMAPLFPMISSLGAVRPMFVFLDIPLGTPFNIDLLPAGLLFALLFSIWLGSAPSRFGQMNGQEIRRRVSSVLGGLFIGLLCTAGGGIAFYFLQEYIPKEVRNGIDSFGVQLDLVTPIPGYEIWHLHGGMIMLIGALIGGRIFWKRAAIATSVSLGAVAGTVSVELPTPSASKLSRRIISQVPEPREIRRPEDVWLAEKARREAAQRQMEELRRQQVLNRREEAVQREQLAQSVQLREQQAQSVRLREQQPHQPPVLTRVQVQRPEEIRKPAVVNRNEELRRQQDVQRQQELQRQQQVQRQQEIEHQQELRRRQELQRLEEIRRQAEVLRLEEIRQLEEIRRLEAQAQLYRDRVAATSIAVVAPARVELPM